MKKAMFKKAANSFAGRMLRRLMGEEKGAVMIEYILVALLIVVAGVVIFSMFGGIISGTGEAAAVAITGENQSGEVEGKLTATRSYVDKRVQNSKTKVNKISRDGEGKTGWAVSGD